MLGRLATKRKRYYSMISTYRLRRDKLRLSMGIPLTSQGNKKFPKEYTDKVDKLQYKIKIWQNAIRRIDNLAFKISSLERCVHDFTGVKISNYTKIKIPENAFLAKSLYYKFGLENKYPPVELRAYIGLIGNHRRHEPTVFRRRFTQSFKKDPSSKEKWMQFKNFHESQIKDLKLDKKRAYGAIPLKIKNTSPYAA